VLNVLHGMYEQIGHRSWTTTPEDDGFASVGLSPDQIERALERLADRGFAEQVTFSGWGITAWGVDAAEQSAVVDQMLPLPSALDRTARADAPAPVSEVHVLDLLSSLGFVGDHEPGLREIVEHDLGELERALVDGLPKAAVLLSGSILEAVLVDVLDRRHDLASPYLKKKRFPDDAGLDDLLQIAASADLVGDGRRLLGPSALAMGSALKEHRDLIHPHAQLRKHIAIDRDTARAMASLLRLVVRDLRAAWEDGTISAYEKK
jgi:hypothetical protein